MTDRVPLPSVPWVATARRLSTALLAAGIVAFLILGANRPANLRTLPGGTILPAPGVAGFDEIGIVVTPGPSRAAPTVARCALLAVTPAQRAAGLRGRTLHGYVGMAFYYPASTTAPSSGAGLPGALSLAWFDGDGRYLAAARLDPCPATGVHRPDVMPPSAFRLALEVPAGGLRTLGIAAGSSVALNGPCIG